MGSTILVTKADGTKFEEILYKSFGEIYKFWKEASWHEPGTEDFTEIGSYAFTGQELDSETGLYYYGARYYNPNIGRFISADSSIDGIFTTQGFNRYTYAGNNPVNYTDPSGNFFWFIVIAIVVPSIVSTTVNSINNGAFTPTLGLSVPGFNCSVSYNTKTGDTSVSAGFGIGIGPGMNVGVNASVTFDKNGNLTGGSIGIGVNFSKGGFGAGLGIGANFNGDGKYTGFSVNASGGYTAGGKTSIGGSLNGAYTWNKDGTQSHSVGAAINSGYNFSSMSVGLNYNSDGSYTGSASYNYDFKGAKAYEEEQAKLYGSAQDRQNQQSTENRDDVVTRPVAPENTEAISIGEISGYPETGKNSWRAENDQIFNNAVNEYNSKYGLKPEDDGYWTPKMLKAQAMIESGGSKEAFLSDPLQVNVSGDWDPKKQSLLGLSKGEKMTPEKSASAGLLWLRYKGFKYDRTGNETTYRGKFQALRNYNGNTTKYKWHPKVEHRNWYANKILLLGE